ncbi:hypothetical protein BV25DRAFT_1710928 [Artomyces pyxidatus]|uniref:Uncharacterized protein n=1 Tax=Artomyces pyxidatus TaxID=48021 RepID=A0ACB8TBQ5_9AGAM|nr:hypothetical protein BV25DRAFT_1710928 [Artomyces pyxidatus]
MVRLTAAVLVFLAASTASALPAPSRVTFELSDAAEYSALDLEVLRLAQVLAGHTLHTVRIVCRLLPSPAEWSRKTGDAFLRVYEEISSKRQQWWRRS